MKKIKKKKRRTSRKQSGRLCKSPRCSWYQAASGIERKKMNGLQLDIINALLKRIDPYTIHPLSEIATLMKDMFRGMAENMSNEDMHVAIMEADQMIEDCGADNQPILVLWGEWLRNNINTDKILEGVPF